MFPTFTGSSRKPRQVNLSGRNPNPFATFGGSAAAKAKAEQERIQRQRERDRVNAAKLLQRCWRGYDCRKGIKQRLRVEWDNAELLAGGDSLNGPPYPTASEALLQLERLLKFIDIHDSKDVGRLHRYLNRQQRAMQAKQVETAGGRWPMAYLRLRTVILSAIDYQLHLEGARWNGYRLVECLNLLTMEIPRESARNSKRYYQTMVGLTRQVLFRRQPSREQSSLILRAVALPLQSISADTLTAYEAFGCVYLTLPDLVHDAPTSSLRFRILLDELANRINYKLLANAMAAVIKSSDYEGYHEMANSKARLRFLGCFIYFHRHAHNFSNPQAYSSHKDFVVVVSRILSSVGDDFVVDPHPRDSEPGDEPHSLRRHEFMSEFLQEQIISLVNQESVRSLLSGASSNAGSHFAEDVSDVEGARELANYALTLLRVFPRRGDEIRMWLYLGSTAVSPSHSVDRSMPAIKYFWQAARSTDVFRSISKDSRAAIKFLKVSLGHSSTMEWQAPGSYHKLAGAEDEWRLLLIFMELYTFVLKVMDDEDFFSAASVGNLGAYNASSTRPRDNALPLGEVKDLTVFLKNLGFTMYYYAAELTDQEERDTNTAGLSSYFSSSRSHAAPEPEKEEKPSSPSFAGVSGMSLDYIKGLVTGLLRMIYERDSRRKFLPKDHWLMTSRFDMEGFIPAVVEEEEKRHSIQEADDEDADDEDSDTTSSETTSHIIGTQRAQQARIQERRRRQQRKASRKRYLQAVAPRLEILQNMPFLIPFTTRVQIFREFVRLDQIKRRHGYVDPEAWRLAQMHSINPESRTLEKHHAKIRRQHELEDAYNQFYQLKDGLKEPIQITFVDEFDMVEAGIDGGGVTKEFLTSVTNQAFNPAEHREGEVKMFIENDQHLLYPNPSALEEKKADVRRNAAAARLTDRHVVEDLVRENVHDLLQRYEFLGRIVGKCLYEGILVDIHFAGFFLLKWALTGGAGSAPKESGYRANLNDLRELDEALYQGLLQLKNHPDDVEDFALNFTVTDTITTNLTTGATRNVTRDLKPGGSDIPVTNENRLVYISYMARHRLQIQPYQQTTAFLRGLSSMIQPSWLSMFNQIELQTLLGGSSTSIDVEDLRRNTQYGGVYTIGDDGLEHPSVHLFWCVMRSFTDDERRAVLKFVTSTPRAPLLGFGSLNPRFSIRDAGSDQSRLPSTSTCVNLLKLPMYKSEKVLAEKLRLAIFSGAGFDLS